MGKNKYFKKQSSNNEKLKIIENLQQKLSKITTTSNLTKFDDLPLSHETQRALSSSDYTSMTDIQKESILPALKGEDILAAAKTGSGKTLSFLIPILEFLYKNQYTPLDGLVSLIISPTRELAVQIFTVLEKISCGHIFSRGMIIGGEKDNTTKISNIIIATPGRLLQHLEENINFSLSSLKILVLDEADRILDMGFSFTINSILDKLPLERQTLLFSATQTKSVSDLARLNLHQPRYISVHEFTKYSTPNTLKQNYITTTIDSKLNILWAFINMHANSKIIVFFATCKQVKFVHQLFTSMRIGSPLLPLHGLMKQPQRFEIFKKFDTNLKSCLFATDLAARGLDFSGVDWVVQFDCPDSAETYIHRVGRTARFNNGGHSLLFLLHCEEDSGFVDKLTKERIPIEMTKINQSLLNERFTNKVQSCCAKNLNLNEMAKKAILAYVKSVYYSSDKSLFNVDNLDLTQLSHSMGLSVTPRIRFLQKSKEKPKNSPKPEKSNKITIDTSVVDVGGLETSKVEFVKRSSPIGNNYNLSDAKRRMESADVSDVVRQINKKTAKKNKFKKRIDSYLADKPLSEIEKLASQFL